MSGFLGEAWAQGGAATPQDAGLMSFIPLILIFVVFYFLLMRPQIKRAKDHKKMVEALAKLDEIVTSGGLLGRVTHLDDQLVTLEVAEGVRIKVQKSAVASQLPKGTLSAGGT